MISGSLVLSQNLAVLGRIVNAPRNECALEQNAAWSKSRKR